MAQTHLAFHSPASLPLADKTQPAFTGSPSKAAWDQKANYKNYFII